jgi:DNA-binding NarL/FixJ family response regulator
MMNTVSPYLVRKDIARMLCVSERTVRRYELRWGLNVARVTVTTRMVRYSRERAILILKQQQFL